MSNPLIEGNCVKFRELFHQILPNESDRRRVFAYLAYCQTTRMDLEYIQIWNIPDQLTPLVQFIVELLSPAKSMRLDEMMERIPYDMEDQTVCVCWDENDKIHHPKTKTLIKQFVPSQVIVSQVPYHNTKSYVNHTKLLIITEPLRLIKYPEPLQRRTRLISFIWPWERSYDLRPTLTAIIETERLAILEYIQQFVPLRC